MAEDEVGARFTRAENKNVLGLRILFPDCQHQAKNFVIKAFCLLCSKLSRLEAFTCTFPLLLIFSLLAS